MKQETVPPHPDQPTVTDAHGTLRFKANKVVEFLFEKFGSDMNSLALMKFSQDDRSQFAQLIGYSVNGYHELSYSKNPGQHLHLDTSLETARALHRVRRALNDGDCPKCHKFHAATEIHRTTDAIECPSCGFYIWLNEIKVIERMFAPAMDAAVEIFEKWRS